MKTNITLKIEADLLREARILATIDGSSISALLVIESGIELIRRPPRRPAIHWSAPETIPVEDPFAWAIAPNGDVNAMGTRDHRP